MSEDESRSRCEARCDHYVINIRGLLGPETRRAQMAF